VKLVHFVAEEHQETPFNVVDTICRGLAELRRDWESAAHGGPIEEGESASVSCQTHLKMGGERGRAQCL
jgi:hypothetical protein